MLLLSIHPVFASASLDGTKRVEFRRRSPRQAPAGSKLAIYASSPTCALVATATIDHYIEATPMSLWRQCREFGGISHSEFMNYFDGAEKAVGILLRSVQPLSMQIGLGELRTWWPGFHPPQQFAYLDDGELATKLRLIAA